MKPDGQNSLIFFVISKWLLAELSFSDRWSRGTKLRERDRLSRNLLISKDPVVRISRNLAKHKFSDLSL